MKSIFLKFKSLLLLLSISTSLLYSQDRTIIGVVKDSKGDPMIGVTIQLKENSKIGTVTDYNGKFQLDVPSNSSLIFSYIGYDNQIIKATNNLTVIMKENTEELDEVVIVGYGQQKKSDLSSSISTVDVNQLKTNSVLPNVANALEGTTPGLSVTTSSGAPGASTNIHVRGVSTFLSSQPLVIIDGAPGNLNDINSNDIESIQVLKDAASAAIYGSRSANGVIIVTTKKGKSGDVRVELGTSYGMQYPGRSLSVANAEQYAIINNTLRQAAAKPTYALLEDPASLGKGTNFQDVFYNPAPIANTYLSIAGGNENSTYRVSGSYSNQKGIAVTSSYQKGIVSFAGQQKKGIFTFGENIGYTKFMQKRVTEWLVQGLLVAQPIIPLYDSANDCGYGGVPSEFSNQGYNAYGYAHLLDNKTNNGNLNMDVYAQMDFLKDFTYKLNVGYKNWFGYDYSYTPKFYMSTNVLNNYATLSENRSESTHWLVENTLMYNKQIAKNNINALVGYTFEEDQFRDLNGSAQGFPNNDVRVIDATTGYSIGAGGSAGQWDMISMLARLIYNYDNKYYITSNIRRDGSSRFASVNRYGVFPSFSAAWRISSEPFFAPLQSVIENLKIRGSYGVLGNQPGGNYEYIPTGGYSTSLGYLFGNGTGFVNGAAVTGYTDSNIQWERTRSSNIGLDADLTNNISLTADVFSNFTDKLLLGVPISPSVGGGSPTTNTGKMQNKGFEFSVNYNSPLSNEFRYKISANISTVRNEVVKLGRTDETLYGSKPANSTTGVTVAKEGYPIGSFFVKQALGIFQNQDEINAWVDKDGNLIQPLAKPGDIKYLDANGDGIINSSDAVYSGNPFPKFSYGLNFSAEYKNFDFVIFLQGTYGNKMFDSNAHRLHQGTTDYNMSTDLLNAWTETNTNTDVPRLIMTDPNHNEDPSSRYLYDASFLRVKTCQFGYSFPKPILKKINLEGLRVYANATNLLTFTKYTGYDPSYTSNGLLDAGLDQSIYPIAKIISCGLTLQF
ncbi:MAG: TonB-dependent receptor [Proteiniphilum sp.]